MNETKPNPNRQRSLWKRFSLFALSIYLGALAVLMFFERSLLFPAPPAEAGEWNATKFDAEEFFVDSDGTTRVHVWLLAKPGCQTTLIFAHGNGETLGFMGEELVEIRERWKVNLVAFDFRGYGKTGGLASENAILADSLAVAKWVESNPRFADQKRVAMGRSLGGAAAIEIATKTRVDGMILDRTFSSIVDIAADRYPIFPIRWVMRNQFRSIEKLPGYTGPLLQMHGDVDELIPYRFGKKLFDACISERKHLLSVQGLYHNDPWPEEFWDAGKKFISDIETK